MVTVWELDFYSRPILDERQKKRWEILICESPLAIDRPLESLFRFSQFCASTEVNSVRLRQVLEQAIAEAPQPPKKIRFFRRPMTNMIVKACQGLGINAQPSRRTLALQQWLDQRMQAVYPTDPNYQPGETPAVQLAGSIPQPLPDALRGQKWAFVSLEARALADMPEWPIDFGEAFPLTLVGLPPEASIPGLIVFSPRALPLAGWMSGLELAFLKFERGPTAKLLLETGANDSWVLATLNDRQGQAEAEAFETRKQKAQGVHFLAVQSNPTVEAFAGFWLLQDSDSG